MNRCRNSYVEQALLPRSLEDLMNGPARLGGCSSLLQDSLDALLKEAKDRFRGYDSCPTAEQAELACRKVSAPPSFIPSFCKPSTTLPLWNGFHLCGLGLGPVG